MNRERGAGRSTKPGPTACGDDAPEGSTNDGRVYGRCTLVVTSFGRASSTLDHIERSGPTQVARQNSK